jgi:hypothetical protein
VTVLVTFSPESVLCIRDLAPGAVATLLKRYGLEPTGVVTGEVIPGSYWGEREAGLLGRNVYFRDDTPIHSVLHEAAHCICMSPDRRAGLDKDAGGDYDEENAVCYLQILLADHLPGVGRLRMWQDMDAWGYSFRLGSTQAWFEHDADDARQWLARERLIDEATHVTWSLRA